MIDISVSGLVKSFDLDKKVLSGLSFEVYEGEKVGLLGKNGAGKTTVFKILSGALSYDAGEVSLARGKRLGLLSQIPVYPGEYTVSQVLDSAFERLYDQRTQLRALEERMKTDFSDAVLKRYGELSHAYEQAGGYETETAKAKVANGLDLPQQMLSQSFMSLSGGEQTRVNLARLILMDTDILLLDEPTNHLDLRATEWLEDFLLKYRGTALIVSHDRFFLDRVVSRIVEIRDGRAELFGGGYSFYVQEKQARYLRALSAYEQEQKKIAQLEEASRRMHTWAAGHDNPALHKRAFAMERRIERLRVTEKPYKDRELRARFSEKEFSADEVLCTWDLSKGFEGKPLFSGLELEVLGGERIGLIGDNGSGKTTLLNLIAGGETPDTGRLRLGPAVKLAYMRQTVTFPHMERTLLDTLLYELDCSPQTARDRLGLFHFPGEEVFKRVSQLSGGERSRLLLCLLMARDINFLMLDEPTNHMDVAAREWIEECVEDFSGTLLFVSHDRYFVRRFATRIWEFEAGQIYDFKGTYDQYRDYRARQARIKELERAAKPPVRKKAAAQPSPEKRARALERAIELAESEIAALELEMAEKASDAEALNLLFEQKNQLSEKLSGLYAEWEAALDET